MILKKPSLESISAMAANSMVSHLGIEFKEIGDDFLMATMPVDSRTVQPFGLLHGGASVALAETLGSMAATLSVDPDRYLCVGQEINANHIKSVRSGIVTGIARPVHIGKNSQVWEMKIQNEEKQLVCISRMTIAVIPIKK